MSSPSFKLKLKLGHECKGRMSCKDSSLHLFSLTYALTTIFFITTAICPTLEKATNAWAKTRYKGSRKVPRVLDAR